MLIVLILSIIFLTSCCFSPTNIQSDIYLVSVAFDYDKMGVNTLSGTLNDQEAIINQIDYLAEQSKRNIYSYQITQKGNNILYRYYTKQSRGEEIEVIKDISLNNIKNEIQNIFTTLGSKKNDLVIFFYAGHGLSSSEKERLGALVLGDISALSVDSNSYKSRIYFLEELRYDFSQVTGNKVIFIDSCHSGAIVKNDIVDKSTDIKSSYQNLFTTYESRNDLVWELSACTADSLAYENEETQDSKAHGKYTKELLEYLGYNFYAEQVEGPGMPYSNQLSVIDAWKYINDKFKRIGKQTPVTSVTERDLVLFTF